MIRRCLTRTAAEPEAPAEGSCMADALCRALSAITGTLDFQELVERILRNLRVVVPNDSANIMLVEGGTLQSLIHFPYDRNERVNWIKQFRGDDLTTLRWMTENQAPLVIAHTDIYEGWVKNDETAWIKSYAGAPLIAKGAVMGFLSVNSSTPGFYSEADGTNLQAFADQAAVALENARLYDLAQQELAERKRAEAALKEYQEHLEELVHERTAELESANERLQSEIVVRLRAENAERAARRFAEALRDAGLVLSSSLEFDRVVDQVLEQIGRVIPYDAAGIFVVEDEQVRLIRARPAPEPAAGEAGAPGGALPRETPSHLGEMVRTLGPAAITDTAAAGLPDGAFAPFAGTRSWVGAPVMAKGRVIACLSLHKFAGEPYEPAQAEQLLAFAGHAALALENARLFAEVRLLAVTDPLTRLYNRRQFFVLAQHEFQRCRRSRKPISLLMSDIDHFKRVNDTWGHVAGDVVLKAVASRFRNSLRANDVIGRYGGEEFAILLPETDTAAAAQVADSIRLVVAAAAVETEADSIPVTVSLGVAGRAGEAEESLESVLRRADQALYHAKAGGRNRVCRADEESLQS
ncbi:MAG: diguanylate cyclase [Acidobacteria bacterium]|nr:diguanylate cyclase [Acidobacteriota bacterium]